MLRRTNESTTNRWKADPNSFRANSTPDVRAYADEWVVLYDGVVVDHGAELKTIVDMARSREVQPPRVLFVESRGSETLVKLGS